jgi:hypothetical protein
VLVVDRAPVGQSWVDRWDSLVPFTSRCFSSLPGMPFPAGRTRCPTRLEMAACLRASAERSALPVRTGVDVHRLSGAGPAFVAETSAGTVRARHVVLATGPYTRPHVPAAAEGMSSQVHQLHSRDYGSTARRSPTSTTTPAPSPPGSAPRPDGLPHPAAPNGCRGPLTDGIIAGWSRTPGPRSGTWSGQDADADGTAGAARWCSPPPHRGGTP